ncbi:MAG TPA: hypothetical protein P5119_00530 [Candidatus Aminicenantes bacterium]|nr:hypothetical protein [Candidatus Aminicenantes bacterium]HRY63809.1 hypothetical protein [Candidatus Aminicenantes bacterium]HRZ70722.1 hypothetical protein [Candidatus Aminicenantes bacterium]
MAITRCPYCHAIIDEADKYCNNCGTQLLFAADDEVEEEIPGEKIIDAEVEEKDYTIDEPEGEKRPAAPRDLEDEIEEELEEETEVVPPDELAGGDEDEPGESEPDEEVILVDEIEEAGAGEEGPGSAEEAGTAETKFAARPAEPEGDKKADEPEGEEEEEDGGEDKKGAAPIEIEEEAGEEIEEELEPPPPSGDEPEVEYVSETPPPDEAATAGEGSLRPVTFDSKDLENLGRTVELSKERVDRFIEGRASAGARPAAEVPPPPMEPEPGPGLEEEPEPEPDAGPGPEPGPEAEDQARPAAEPGPEPEERSGAEAGPPPPPAASEPPTGSLPPWASTLKGAPVFPGDTGPVEARRLHGEPDADTGDEVEIFPRRRGSDSTIGLPETVRQAPLPFGTGEAGEEAGEEGDEELADEEQGEWEGSGEAAAASAEPRDLTPEEAILPAGQVGPRREPILPGRPREAAGAGAVPAFEAEEEAGEPEARPPFSFSVFFKSKAFDILFVGVFWIAALWLAAGSLGRTLFEVLGGMSGPMLLLYGAFLLIYFFLFRFFLGETLGDRLFRRRE